MKTTPVEGALQGQQGMAARGLKRALFTIVGGAVLITPALAQEQSMEELEEIVVTGLRGSLKASLEIKRDAVGVVDAISAEDIGKFPDANLSEALQRITGVSIDRRNGEGALVTARGFGAEFNMVTLNGRQMPTADAFAGGALIAGGIGGNTRSFNFANLAAESVSALEVYKTGRADIATGGIGASINVRTARPFDNDGTVANVGAKAVTDTTNRVGDDFTPEVSGIFSFTNDEKTWGVGLSASYQKRDSGSSGSTVNDWRIQAWDADMSVNQTLAPLYVNRNDTPYDRSDDFLDAEVRNAPAVGQLYGIPNDIRYHFADRERERTNAQLTIQFAPTDALTLTADYTYALNELIEDRGDQTIWLQRNGFYYLEFDDGAVKTPLVLREYTGASKDYGYEQQHREQKNELKSIGFNADWQVTDRFRVSFDIHDSTAESLPNDPLTGGGETTFSFAGNVRSQCLEFYGPNPEDEDEDPACRNQTNFWTQEFYFNDKLPTAGRTLYPDQFSALAGVGGNSNFSFDESNLGSQILRINYQDQVTDLTQARLDGAIEFDEGRFQFGIETRALETHQRGSVANMTLGDWGVSDTGNVPDMVALLRPFSLVNAFDDFSAPGAPTGGWKGNANVLAQWALSRGYGNWTEDAAPDGQLRYNPGFAVNQTIQEDTNAIYIQFALQGELGGMPTNLLVGARYERTEVESTASVLRPTGLLWQDDNDFQIIRPPLLPENIENIRETADYDNVLPSLDFDIGLTDSLKARFSTSTTIARARYGDLAAGAGPNTPNGSTLLGAQGGGTANNPALVPLESDNLDLTLEWYFSDNGYVSVGFWDKRVKNFIGNEVVEQEIFGILDQTSGVRARQAYDLLDSGGHSINDSALWTMMAMIEHPEGFTDADGVFWAGGSAAYNGSGAQHVAWATQFDIVSGPGDEPYIFAVTRPVNNKEANIHGWEFGGQYFFGDTGFGVLANYTVVRGDVGFNDASDPNENQFALLGLSDSANFVLMYENFGFTVRLAYNWRDEFLSQVNAGSSRNPIYVEEYQQVDLSIGYDVNDHLSVSFEGLNLTEEDVRWHGRSKKQLWFLEDQGARYALGARYKF
jgi:TonB-dependent receptor